MDDFYFIAQIVSAGKEGFVKIQSLTENADNFFQLNTDIYLDFWGRKKKFIVEETVKVKNSFFIKFLNFDDERDALVLIGRKIFISEKDFNLLDDRTYSVNELVGCTVFKNEEFLGTVKDAFNTPANDVVEILKLDGKEILIPFVDAYFDLMDVKNQKLILKPDVGYYDDED